MFPRYLEAFLTPDSFDSFVVDTPPIHAHEIRNNSVTVTAISGSVINNRFANQNVVFGVFCLITLCAAILSED